MSKDNLDKDTDINNDETAEETYEATEDREMKGPGEQNAESPFSMNGVTIMGRKIGFGYIAMGALIVVILFFGAKSKIMDYFSEPHKLAVPVIEAPAIDTPAMGPTPTDTMNPPAAESMPAPNMQGMPSGMTEDQIKDVVKNYILNNPEVIMDSLTKLQKKSEEQQAQASKDYIHKSGGTMAQGKPFVGNKDGTMNIVEFFDYQCVHCKLVYPDLVKLMQAYPNLKISLVQLPFMGPDSAKAVKFSMAVNNLYPDKFNDFHSDLLKANTINEQFIFDLVTKYGMNKDNLIKESNSDSVTKMINENLDLAQKSGVRGVPSFIINGEFIPGAPSYDDLKMKIDAIKTAQ
jgi:protein-disulfide isomerase